MLKDRATNPHENFRSQIYRFFLTKTKSWLRILFHNVLPGPLQGLFRRNSIFAEKIPEMAPIEILENRPSNKPRTATEYQGITKITQSAFSQTSNDNCVLGRFANVVADAPAKGQRRIRSPSSAYARMAFSQMISARRRSSGTPLRPSCVRAGIQWRQNNFSRFSSRSVTFLANSFLVSSESRPSVVSTGSFF